MNALLAMTIIFLVFAFGDLVATKTKAIVSSMLACAIVFMIWFWAGAPATIFTDSGLMSFATVTIGMFLVHIGSTIKLKDLITEWKTVVISLISTLLIAFGVYFIGQFIIDRYYALVGGPTIAGGMVAYLVIKGVGDIVGRDDVAVFALMVISLQALAGIPIASQLCKKEGTRILQDWKDGKYIPPAEPANKPGLFGNFKIFPSVPEKYNSANFILFKTALLALAGLYLGKITPVNQLIYCLIFGILFHELGFLDEACLTKSNGFTFVMAGAMCTVFAGLANTTPQVVLSMLPSLLVVIVLGLAIGFVVSVAVGRIVHLGWRMSFAIAVTALIGFPGTFILSREVSDAVGKDEEEVHVVMDYIMPKMIIGGIVSVSVVSGIAASIMLNWI
jgi:hypothetical protein